MPEILLGILVVALLLWGAQGFTKIDPKKLAPAARTAAGLAVFAVALFLATRGLIFLPIWLGLAALWLSGWLPAGMRQFFDPRAPHRAGRISRVRSALVEMELDHDSGVMRGRILAGRYDGVSLDQLSTATIASLLPAIDEESRALLVAYLDRRDPGWRENAKDHATAGNGGAAGGKMTQEEAYQILGLQPGASAQEIGRAHRSLMKKLHPDQGGSTYLAARVNEAKEVLLRRHR
jgi:hypothetical protein